MEDSKTIFNHVELLMHKRGLLWIPFVSQFPMDSAAYFKKCHFLPVGKFTQENSLSRHLGPSKTRQLVFLAIVLHFDTSPRSLLGGIFPMQGDFFTNTQF
jgi:hypothetical protein